MSTAVLAGLSRRTSTPLMAAFLLAASLSAASAQTGEEPPVTGAELRPGERIRITTAASPRPVSTRLHAMRGDSLLLPSTADDPAMQMLVPASHVQRLEVRRRPRKLLGENVTAGGFIGMLAGGVGFLLWCDGNRDECRDMDEEPPYYVPPEDRPVSAGVGLMLGSGIVGAAVGYLVTPKRWVPVDLSVTAVPAGGTGVQLGATLPVQGR